MNRRRVAVLEQEARRFSGGVLGRIDVFVFTPMGDRCSYFT